MAKAVKEATPKAATPKAASKSKKTDPVAPSQLGATKQAAVTNDTSYTMLLLCTKTMHLCFFVHGTSGIASFFIIVAFAACLIVPLIDEKIREDAKTWMEKLESMKVLSGWVSLLDFAGSSLVCYGLRRGIETAIKNGSERERYMHSTPLSHYAVTIFTGLFSQFGGTTSTALLLGQNPSWSAGNHVVHAYLLAWWLTFCCPFDIWYKLMATPWFWLPWQTLACISSSHACTSWGLEKALVAEHVRMQKSAYAALACGYLSGCFGWVFVGFFETGGERLKTSGPSWAMQRTFYTVLGYYFATDPHGYLDPYKAMLQIPTASKPMGKVGVCVFILVCQVGLDICKVDILKYLNKATAVVAAMIAPVNMDLPKAKDKQE